jgi:hypothetical protein
MLCAVNYSELLIGPIKSGTETRDHVDHMLGHFAIEIMVVDMAFAKHAAAVRARTGLKLPDAYALAAAIHSEHRGFSDVTLASFDAEVLRAHAELHPQGTYGRGNAAGARAPWRVGGTAVRRSIGRCSASASHD